MEEIFYNSNLEIVLGIEYRTIRIESYLYDFIIKS